MNLEGAVIWARLTKANIGRAIAISLDNYIYSYPDPSEQITGGYNINSLNRFPNNEHLPTTHEEFHCIT